jgi:Carboxypeptidase regulatory-like domain/Cytochrome c554 and c-prime
LRLEHARQRWTTAVAVAALAGVGACSDPHAIHGVVVDEAGQPVPGARVRLQAAPFSALTSGSGSFVLRGAPAAPAQVIAAWKEGYFNAGEKLAAGRSGYRIVLKAIPPGDDPSYAWAPPRAPSGGAPPDEKAPICERCHPLLVSEWEQSAHSGSATNPLFLAVFEGKDRAGAPTGGPGYRLDFPRSEGNCAACHAPGLAVNAPFGTDPTLARGAAAGISCDVCHKVRDAQVDDSGGRPGVLSLRFARPAPGKDAFFGQLDDVTAGPDAHDPLYRESRYCAPCHHGTFWRVRAYSEFAEWAESPYATRNVHCQDCHMKLRGGPRRFALEKEGGLLRDPATLSSHVQYGLNDERFMKDSVHVTARAHSARNRIHVRVAVTNSGAGHHVPTGSPMRNMILLVEARDARGASLPLVAGERVPDWAGRGSPASGDYAGLPGKGFAKVLADLVEYPGDPSQGRRFARAAPAPYWRPTAVVSDTRIAAEATDESTYEFDADVAGSGPVTVLTRLVYRRTFRSWGALDRIKPGELELATTRTEVAR